MIFPNVNPKNPSPALKKYLYKESLDKLPYLLPGNEFTDLYTVEFFRHEQTRRPNMDEFRRRHIGLAGTEIDELFFDLANEYNDYLQTRDNFDVVEAEMILDTGEILVMVAVPVITRARVAH